MAGADNSVTREGMLAAADRMTQTLRLVDTERGEVEASISRLFGTFTGSAADAYRQAFSGWFRNVEDIRSALNSMIETMRSGADEVGKTVADTQGDAEDGAGRMASAFPGLNGL
ncbi:WXG100 family type VII secretion target [Lentzea sp. NPDC006480]|uniref:WXG100 family type VII secretion target n=1 Tax=Lentzea sp. NPDC006480 TaxID=3157176 RepID=UPI00339EB443